MVSVQEDMLNSRVPYSCMEGYTGVHKFFKILRKNKTKRIYMYIPPYTCMYTYTCIYTYICRFDIRSEKTVRNFKGTHKGQGSGKTKSAEINAKQCTH